ncbi:17822_t:CDS:2 [Acaulospora morrowiae]|uniref:17822_t:CDS:1 n=1 Tax=Acaulospora morrowiae TaxID=94023 RepID=A0A9N8VL07_9GLOM|nr:17822_t:CDS:2 [Acaulospora morrowiae]
MTSFLKKQQKIIFGLFEIIKHLDYNIHEVQYRSQEVVIPDLAYQKCLKIILALFPISEKTLISCSKKRKHTKSSLWQVGVTLEEYEERLDKFNICEYSEWINGDVIVYELPSKPHSVLIAAITSEIIKKCLLPYVCDIKRIFVLLKELVPMILRKKGMHASTLKSYECNNQMEDEPWPNLIIEVAYSKNESYILEKVKDFWLRNWSHAQNVIVVKIDKPFEAKHAPLWIQGQTQKNS